MTAGFRNSETTAGKKESTFAVAAPSLNLPKGGGAIRGIGEKFGNNPVTGTGSITIPIETTPGRSGFQPQLALSYDSGAGNGAFGIGWSLSLPTISRKTDKGIPQYSDSEESDVFLLSGSEDLVPLLLPDGKRYEVDTPEGYRIHRYVPRIEGLFARIERWTHIQDGDVHWRSITRDNILTIYGKNNNSRIADPQHPLHIFSWLICETRDDRGNAILYQYLEERGQGIDATRMHEQNRANTRTANRYLKRIVYCNRKPLLDAQGRRPDFVSDSSIQRAEWLLESVFDYGEGHYSEQAPDAEGQIYVNARLTGKTDPAVRQDPFSSYRAGFEVRSYRLCKRVLMFHHFPEELGVEDYLTKSTEFSYRETPIGSFIVSAKQSGYLHMPQQNQPDRYLKRSLPDLEFEYSRAPAPEEMAELQVQDVALENLEMLPGGSGRNQYHWVDLDAEGLSGMLTEQTTGWYYKRNLSANNLVPAGDGQERAQARFGGLELVPSLPPANLNSGESQFQDLAGDGQVDLVQLGGAFSGFYERDPGRGWESHRVFQSRPELNLNDPNLRFVDLTGDGRADILITQEDVLTWYPSLGEEGFAAARRVQQSLDEEKGPRIVFADATQSIYLADFSGDGLSDLVRVRNGEVCYWPNLGYGRFGRKVTMDNSPWFDYPEQFDQARIRLADIDGSGVTDILYVGHDRTQIYFNQSGNGWSNAVALPQLPAVDEVSAIQAVDLLGNGTACLAWFSPFTASEARPIRYLDLMNGQKPHLLTRVKNNLGAETHIRYAPSTKFYLDDKLAGRDWVTPLPFPVHVVERVEVYDRISGNRFVTRYSYHHGYFDGEEREFRGFGLVEQRDTEELGADVQATNFDAASYVPPVLTRTWFHTGVYQNGEAVSRQYAHEYFGAPAKEDPSFDAYVKTLLEDTIQPATSLNADEMRQAARAMKGAVLRQETYAEDGTPKQAIPYVISERSYSIDRVQRKGDNRHAVFFTYVREGITYHCERNPSDPRVQHEVTLKTDRFGNVEQSINIGYARTNVPDRLPEQNQTHVVLTLNRLVNLDDEPKWRRIGLPVETRAYEVVKPQSPSAQIFSFSELKSLVDVLVAPSGEPIAARVIAYGNWDWRKQWNREIEPGGEIHSRLRLVEHLRTLYRADNLAGFLSFGQVESRALSGESYKLAFTPEILSSIYKRVQNENLLPNPASVLGSKGPDGGGYVDLDGNGCWWVPSGRIFYDTGASVANPASTAAQEVTEARNHFFLPRKYTDPFNHSTTVTFDQYDLLLLQSEDALGNKTSISERDRNDNTIASHNSYGKTTESRNDYRICRPELVTDPNRNRSAVIFDAFGQVVATAVMGKNTDTPQLGDVLTDFTAVAGLSLRHPPLATLQNFVKNPFASAPSLLKRASTRILYDFDRFRRCGQPSFAAVLVRETHVSDLQQGQGSKIQISFNYSDGFGREIQSKIQAEPGDGPVRNPELLAMFSSDVRPGPLVLQNGEPGTGHAEHRWVAGGRTVYNNKGAPIKKYEPFFSSTHLFEEESEVTKTGVTPILFYDALNRVLARLHPNHTYEKFVFDAWREETWDLNDTVMQADPRNDEHVGAFFQRLPVRDFLPSWHAARQSAGLGVKEEKAAQKTNTHSGTAAIAHADSLGKTFLNIAHNRLKYSDAPSDDPGIEVFQHTSVSLDVEENQREVRDGVLENNSTVSRLVMSYDFDMLSNNIHQWSMEAGQRWTLYDVTGISIRTWDSRGHSFRTECDALRRPIRSFVAGMNPLEPDDEIIATVEMYGEQALDAARLNLRGKLLLHCDQGGLVINADKDAETDQLQAYDYKGNLLRTKRWIVSNYKSATDWNRANWRSVESLFSRTPLRLDNLRSAFASLVEVQGFSSSSAYDAMSRPVLFRAPDQSVIRLTYNEATLLEKVDAVVRGATANGDPIFTPFVKNIDYNAKGQRTQIQYGNGVIRKLEYDTKTSLLKELKTIRTSDSAILQDVLYTYDPVGNIINCSDNAQQALFFRNRRVDPESDYTYDSVYRLVEATGREHLGQVGGNPIPHSYNDTPRARMPWSANDGNAVGRYIERYVYDPFGNLLKMHHRGADPANAGWTRLYSYDEPSQIEAGKQNNRLSKTTLGQTSEIYSTGGNGYDSHGNMLHLPQVQVLQWNCKDELQMTQRQAVNSQDIDGSQHEGERTYYVYDTSGKRVRKVTEGSNGEIKDEWIYLGGLQIYRKNGPNPMVRETLQIMDDQQLIACIETRTEGNAPGPAELVRYQLSDHVGSVNLELDADGKILSYEEYTPFGSTTYQAVRSLTEAPKRCRYAGKERDEESGLYYFGARYYAPWLARWTSCDPAGFVDALNLFQYAMNNPIRVVDLDGKQSSGKPTVIIELPSTITFTDKKKQPIHLPGKLIVQTDKGTRETELKQKSTSIPYTHESNYTIPENEYIPDLGGYLEREPYTGELKFYSGPTPWMQAEDAARRDANKRWEEVAMVIPNNPIASLIFRETDPFTTHGALFWITTLASVGVGWVMEAEMLMMEAAAMPEMAAAESELAMAPRAARPPKLVSNEEVAEALAQAKLEHGSTTLYHGGILEGGEVNANRIFSTTTEMEYAEIYAARKSGTVYRFDVPNARLKELKDAQMVIEGVDSLQGTSTSATEWRFSQKFLQQGGAKELNQYRVQTTGN